MATWRTVRPLRVLDFDVETLAAGFDDPNWVPQKITCVAWSWIGSDVVEAKVSGVKGLFGQPERRARMLEPLLAAIDEADVITGHNLIRFDLPIVNSECLRLGLPSLGPKLVQDTMKIVKTKGFKKGQDNLGKLVKTPMQKFALNWQEWQNGYDEPDWGTVIERAKSDVVQHKQLRVEMIERGWLKPPTMWKP